MHHIGRWNVPQLRHAFLPAPFPFEMTIASISSRERGLWVSTVDSSSVLHECGKRSRGFMSSSCAEAIYPRSTWWSSFNEEPLFFTSVKSYPEASCPHLVPRLSILDRPGGRLLTKIFFVQQPLTTLQLTSTYGPSSDVTLSHHTHFPHGDSPPSSRLE